MLHHVPGPQLLKTLLLTAWAACALALPIDPAPMHAAATDTLALRPATAARLAAAETDAPRVGPPATGALVRVPTADPSAAFPARRGWIALGTAAAILVSTETAPPAGPGGREPLDLAVANRFCSPRVQGSGVARGVAATMRFAALPGSLIAAAVLFGAGHAADRPQLSELGLHTAQAIAVAGASTVPVKLAVGRARPHESPHDPYDLRWGRGTEGDRFQSFPSAHSAAAFAAASLLAAELAERHPHSRRWVTPLLYGSATLGGVSRLFHEEHWASDVATGAIIGIVAGRQTFRYHR
jgi:membrane-associated phospholipid phosphatase